jgi:mono/diheme cytochrome c family protein
MRTLTLLSLSIAALATASAWAADGPKGDAANGRALYMTKGCSYCHGTAGQGGGGRTGGLRIANQGIGFPAFLSQLRHPVNEMPPYVESAMPDQQVADIFAFVSSLPPPPDAKSIPLLNR